MTRGQKVDWIRTQYYNGNLPTGAYTAIQKGAAWRAWVAADTVMRRTVDRPFDPDHARSTKL